MTKHPFDLEHTANRIKMHMLGSRFHKKVILLEGPSDTQFYHRMFANTVHTRAMYSRETVVGVCKLLEETDFPCYGIVDLDYYWFHSEQASAPGNVLALDENNLESFVLFEAQNFESWNNTGTPDTILNIIQCAISLGILRCINHAHYKNWRFKPDQGSNNPAYHLRPEIRQIFHTMGTQSPEVLLPHLLELFSLSETEYQSMSNDIHNSSNYALSRLVNGKDLNTFLSLSGMPDVYVQMAEKFSLEIFRNTQLGEQLEPLGVLKNG